MRDKLTGHSSERRKAPRHRVSLFGSVALVEPPYEADPPHVGPTVSAITVNISVDGLSLIVNRSNYITKAALSEDDRLLRVVLNLPSGESGVVELIVRIRQPAVAAKGALRAGHQIGVQIHRMSAPHRALYNEYISTLP